jgi:hypothetical protein
MATLTELRATFKSETGRDDLSPVNIDKYLNDGIRMLDRLSSFQFSPAEQYVPVAINDRNINLSSDCTAIEKVWLIDSTTGRKKLVLVSKDYMIEEYGDLSAQTPGPPEFYCPRIVRPTPISFDPTIAPYSSYSQYIDVIKATSNYQTYRGLTIAPKADKAYLLAIEGKFFSPALSDTVTTNWWAYNHPTAVIQAAMYQLYGTSYKNAEASKHIAGLLKDALTSMDMDIASEEAADVDKMEG